MNYVPVLEQVRREKPNYLFELSVWDGQVPGARTDKASFYRQRGERLSPARVAGMTQFGMWLLRPNVVREFCGPADDRGRFGAYFEETLKAVERVRGDAVLKRFWETGRLLTNNAEEHPYQQSLPSDFAKQGALVPAGFERQSAATLKLDTLLNVFALALETGAGDALNGSYTRTHHVTTLGSRKCRFRRSARARKVGRVWVLLASEPRWSQRAARYSADLLLSSEVIARRNRMALRSGVKRRKIWPDCSP